MRQKRNLGSMGLGVREHLMAEWGYLPHRAEHLWAPLAQCPA